MASPWQVAVTRGSTSLAQVWRDNLVLYPDGRTAGSGNGPCIMAWGGANEVFENNTCVTRGSGGPGVDPYHYGAEGSACDYANATSSRILLQLARNRYLSAAANYTPTCGRSLAALQALGVEVGSEVGAEPSVERVLAIARGLLE